jgi:hypothetical protein
MSKVIRSEVYLSDVIPNKNRRFGAALKYYPAFAVLGNKKIPMLFTLDQIRTAIKRGMKNYEDVEGLRLEGMSEDEVHQALKGK